MSELTKFRKALKSIFAGEDGKLVAEFLTSSYVDSSVLEADVNTTIYRLGQKEFVQGLIKDAYASEEK